MNYRISPDDMAIILIKKELSGTDFTKGVSSLPEGPLNIGAVAQLRASQCCHILLSRINLANSETLFIQEADLFY